MRRIMKEQKFLTSMHIFWIQSLGYMEFMEVLMDEKANVLIHMLSLPLVESLVLSMIVSQRIWSQERTKVHLVALLIVTTTASLYYPKICTCNWLPNLCGLEHDSSVWYYIQKKTFDLLSLHSRVQTTSVFLPNQIATFVNPIYLILRN